MALNAPAGTGLHDVPLGAGSWYARCTGDLVGRRVSMDRQRTVSAVLLLAAVSAAAPSAHTQDGAETFTATATVKAAGGATASAPVTIVIDRTMSQAEADRLTAAFAAGGVPALRKALAGAPPTGSVQVGAGTATATRLTLERPTPNGRLLTIVTDQPIFFLGAGVPGQKPKVGYDFALVDLEVDANGSGSGTLSPAAKVAVKAGAFVVSDYASELIKLTDVKKVK